MFLLSLKAGGTGLNLTRADHVVHVDRWWNPAVEEQATDRAYRIGQTRPVQVHRLVTRGTIEERIAELLTRKRALADSVLARGEAALTELSNDDLRDLVTLRRDRRTSPMTAVVSPPVRAPRRGAARADAVVGQGVGARGRGVGVRRARPASPARTLARSGRVGGITTDDRAASWPRSRTRDGLWTVAGTRAGARRRRRATALVETVAAEAGRIAALLAGDLPHALVEHAEEAGVELLPYGGELATELHLRRLGRPVRARAGRALPADLADRGRPVRAAPAARAAARRAAGPAARPRRAPSADGDAAARPADATSTPAWTPRSRGRGGCSTWSTSPAGRSTTCF